MSISLLFLDGLGKETIEYENLIKNTFKKHIDPLKIKINKIIFLTSNIEYKNNDWVIHTIPKLNYVQYSNLLFNGLGDYFDDEKIIHIQTDGFMQNNTNWDDEFLNYDYIGAPWPATCNWCGGTALVGNGGFSIRSKKLYNLTKNVVFLSGPNTQYLTTNDDVFISATIRKYLEENEIKFAPVELAKRFSVEIPIEETHNLQNSFGFHGKHYMEQNEFLREYLK